jgi:fido (protein-threonine AMPylation protein)
MPESSRGRLRNVKVWLGPPGSTLEEATFIPPDDVERLLHEFLLWWRSGYADLQKRDKPAIVESLAQFHHRFLSFHPFLDANGRVARILLDQAARELLDLGLGVELISDPVAYLDSLKAADKGDLKPLVKLIEASLR